jgi:hypothetical protein
MAWGIRLTPPYGKSVISGQMRHAIAAMRGSTRAAEAPGMLNGR